MTARCMTAHRKLGLLVLLPVAGLAACAQPPMGPMVQALPGSRKSFEAFQYDGASCQQYAQGAVAGQAQQANNQAVGGAVLGTLLGAGLGAAIGGGRGAAVGAASGALLGTAGGSEYSAGVQGSIQAQYDNAYVQCMYGKGNRVAGLPDPDLEGRTYGRSPFRRAPVRQAVRVRAPVPRAAGPSEPQAIATPVGGGMKAPMPAE